MAGLQCAKEIIDSAARSTGWLFCVSGSVAMRAPLGQQPTEKQVERLKVIEHDLGALVKDILETIGGG